MASGCSCGIKACVKQGGERPRMGPGRPGLRAQQRETSVEAKKQAQEKQGEIRRERCHRRQ